MNDGKMIVSIDLSEILVRMDNIQQDITLLKDQLKGNVDPWGTYTTEQVGELFGVSPQTITSMVKDGRLTPIPKMGKRNMFRKKDIHKILGVK